MPALRLMSFNLRRDVVRDGPNRWGSRKDAVAAVVHARRPHVVGTQEGLRFQLEDLDQRLPGYARVGGDRRGDGTDEHCAIYYDTARLELVAAGDFWLSDRPDRPGSATWGNDLPRMTTWARFRDREAPDVAPFTVANTHLDHRSSRARRRSAALLAERLPGALLIGDFNSVPGGNVHSDLLAGGWCDAHLASGRTHAGARWRRAPADDPTFHGFTGRATHRFDWVLAPRRMRVLSHSVVRDRPDGRYPSDHFPVMADVLVGPQAV